MIGAIAQRIGVGSTVVGRQVPAGMVAIEPRATIQKA